MELLQRVGCEAIGVLMRDADTGSGYDKYQQSKHYGDEEGEPGVVRKLATFK